MMGSVCAEQQDKFHHTHQLNYLTKKSLREIDIPPRKLLSRHSSASSPSVDIFIDSPKMEDAVFSKFLPYNIDDDDSDPYSSDYFRMYEFKVRKCNRSRSHDWTDCPFAHPGEKARRRDPRTYHYSGTVCSEFRGGHCIKGDNCGYSHGVFECWLHPSRYRTEACKDGKNCKRKVCFFAHSTRQLRIVPETSPSPPLSSPMAAEKKCCNINHCFFAHSTRKLRIVPETSASPPLSSPMAAEKKCCNLNHCRLYYHFMTASPTSPLMGISQASPPVSPPISPVCSPEFSPYGVESYGRSRFGSVEPCSISEFSGRGMCYKEALTELMSSLEAMNVNESAPSPAAIAASNSNLPWLDVNFNVEEQQQFVLSPSANTPEPSRGYSKSFTGGSKFHEDFSGRNLMDDSMYNSESSLAGPYLGWLNDLLT